MSNLAVALAIMLDDKLSGAPARKVSDAIRGIGKTASEVGKGLSSAFRTGFSVDNIDLALRRNEQKLVAARRRLVAALGMAATIAIPVRLAANFQDELIDFIKVSEIPIERMGEIEQRLMLASRNTGKSKSELLSAVATYVGKGMDFAAAFDALQATGRAATATKSEISDMSNSGFAVMDNMNVKARDLAAAFNAMAISGKEGSFELQAMSRKFPEVTAGARALKMEGVAGVASLAAALQIAMKSAGSEDQAATNFTNFLGKITAPDTVKKFAKMGVNIKKEMQKASDEGVDVLDHMLGVIADKTGGDAFKMGELFQDKQVLDFLKAIIPNLEEYRRIRDKALAGENVIDKDFGLEAMKANFAFKGLKNSIDGLLGSSGALLPVITDITNSLTGVVNGLTDWTIANPELTSVIVKTTAGLLAFGVASRVGAFAFYSLRGGVIKTIATFFKFNEAGKNVSIVARALRGLRFVMGALNPLKWATLIPKLSWLLFVPKFAWKAVLTPLRWAMFLPKLAWSVAIGRIGWTALAGKLSWRTLIQPLRWGSQIPKLSWLLFIPKFAWKAVMTPLRWAMFLPKLAWSIAIGRIGWTALAGKLSWRMLILPLKWGTRLIPVIGWALLAGELIWDLLIKPLGWDKYFSMDSFRKLAAEIKATLSGLFSIGGGNSDTNIQVRTDQKNDALNSIINNVTGDENDGRGGGPSKRLGRRRDVDQMPVPKPRPEPHNAIPVPRPIRFDEGAAELSKIFREFGKNKMTLERTTASASGKSSLPIPVPRPIGFEEGLAELSSIMQQFGKSLKEPAYAPASAAATPPAPVVNYTNSPNINVSAIANVKNEANSAEIARKIGAMAEKKTRMALSDAGAE